MTSKMMYEIINLLCCFVCAASIQGPGTFLFGDITDWNFARKACEDNQTRLPNVKMSQSGLQLEDMVHGSPNECFWIGATYELITNYAYDTFPTLCCGTITKINDKFIRDCDNCDKSEQFICESGPDTVSEYKPQFGPVPWINASKECTDRNLLLPSVNNSFFLGRVRDAVWWINEARKLNLSPMAAKDGDIPLCFCDATSLKFQCSTNVKTYCMPHTRTNNITTGILQQGTPSTDTFSTKPTANVVAMGPGKFLFGDITDWNLARKTCQDSQTRLPNVKMSQSGLQLEDMIHWNPNECFWIGATYELITNYSYDTFPTLCCGTITKRNNNFIRDCENCDKSEQFICESAPDTVSEYRPQSGARPWINAARECIDRGLLLPSVNNAFFMGRVRDAVWWINEARILNRSPMAAKNGDIPLCFCDATSLNFQCSTNVKTYCMPHSASNLNAPSYFQPGSKLDMLSTNIYETVISISGESLQGVTPVTIVNAGPTGNGTLVGSLIGSGVAVIIILAIGMIVIVRRIRTKSRATDDTQYVTHMTARTTKKVQPQMNILYDVFDDTALPQIQTVPQVPELHTQNANQISINNKDYYKSKDNKNIRVQKGQIMNDPADVIEEGTDNNQEYDNIEFQKRYVSESSGDMYDNASMHRLDPDKEQDENVYNMTGFSCTTFDKTECNAYDNGNFSPIENSHDDITQGDFGFIDGTYDYVEC